MIIMIILMTLAAVAVSVLLVQVRNLRKESARIFQKAVLHLHMSMDGRCAVRGSWGQCPHCLLDSQQWEFDQRYHGFVEESYEEARLKERTEEYEQAYIDTYASDWELFQLLS